MSNAKKREDTDALLRKLNRAFKQCRKDSPTVVFSVGKTEVGIAEHLLAAVKREAATCCRCDHFNSKLYPELEEKSDA